MAWRGRSVALKLTLKTLPAYLNGLKFTTWRPSGMVLHNTAIPSGRRWLDYPGERWLKNLKTFYTSLGWSAGPHLFIGWNGKEVEIWVMTDLNVRGTHSPSWNGTRIGVEMVADFASEDDDAGWGLQVKQTTAAVFAMIHAKMGWDPTDTAIRLHKEDPQTDHDCPGKDIVKAEFINLVLQYMGDGGEHPADWSDVGSDPKPAPAPLRKGKVRVPAGETLVLRSAASQSSKKEADLANGASLVIKGEAKNGSTLWYSVDVPSVTGGGWVSGRYVVLS